jgi:hypothetical protein
MKVDEKTKKEFRDSLTDTQCDILDLLRVGIIIKGAIGLFEVDNSGKRRFQIAETELYAARYRNACFHYYDKGIGRLAECPCESRANIP